MDGQNEFGGVSPTKPNDYEKWQRKRGHLSYEMTLRDYFAAKAMQELMRMVGENDTRSIPPEAYKMADSMIKFRSGGANE